MRPPIWFGTAYALLYLEVMLKFQYLILSILVLLVCDLSWAATSKRAKPRRRAHRVQRTYHKAIPRPAPKPVATRPRDHVLGLPLGNFSEDSSESDISTADLANHRCSKKDRNPMVCMACNVFFEANLESDLGKLKVARSTKARVFDQHYPKTVCGVVWQRKQFSWTWQKKNPVLPKDPQALEKVLAAAREGLSGTIPLADRVDNYWNDNQVHPKFAKSQLCISTKRVVDHHSFCQSDPYQARDESIVAAAEGRFWDQFNPSQAQGTSQVAFDYEAGAAQ